VGPRAVSGGAEDREGGGDEDVRAREDEGGGDGNWLRCEEDERAGGRSGGVAGWDSEEDGDGEEGLFRSGRRRRG